MSEYPGAPDEARNSFAVPTFVVALIAIAIGIAGS